MTENANVGLRYTDRQEEEIICQPVSARATQKCRKHAYSLTRTQQFQSVLASHPTRTSAHGTIMQPTLRFVKYIHIMRKTFKQQTRPKS